MFGRVSFLEGYSDSTATDWMRASLLSLGRAPNLPLDLDGDCFVGTMVPVQQTKVWTGLIQAAGGPLFAPNVNGQGDGDVILNPANAYYPYMASYATYESAVADALDLPQLKGSIAGSLARLTRNNRTATTFTFAKDPDPKQLYKLLIKIVLLRQMTESPYLAQQYRDMLRYTAQLSAYRRDIAVDSGAVLRQLLDATATDVGKMNATHSASQALAKSVADDAAAQTAVQDAKMALAAAREAHYNAMFFARTAADQTAAQAALVDAAARHEAAGQALAAAQSRAANANNLQLNASNALAGSQTAWSSADSTLAASTAASAQLIAALQQVSGGTVFDSLPSLDQAGVPRGYGVPKSRLTAHTPPPSLDLTGDSPLPPLPPPLNIVHDQSSGWRQVASENQTGPEHFTVRYGTQNAWLERDVEGAWQCTNAFFGGDPAPGIVKSCIEPPLSTSASFVTDPSTGWTRVASEGGTFTGNGAVRFGSGTSWMELDGVQGVTPCTNAYFGRDPLPGVVKQCVVPPSVAAVTAVTPMTINVRDTTRDGLAGSYRPGFCVNSGNAAFVAAIKGCRSFSVDGGPQLTLVNYIFNAWPRQGGGKDIIVYGPAEQSIKSYTNHAFTFS